MALKRRLLLLLILPVLAAAALSLAPGHTARADAPAYLVDNNGIANTPGTCLDATPGDCSLRRAINLANTDGLDSTITFADNYTISLNTINLQPIANDGTLTITGTGRDDTVIQRSTTDPIDSGTCPNSGRIFRIDPGAEVTITGVTIRYGCGVNNGAGILNEGTLTLVDSDVVSNVADRSGGGIYNRGMTNITDSAFIDNSASFGGGIYNNDDGTVMLNNNSRIEGNSANFGGGIYNAGGQVTVNNSVFEANEALQFEENPGGDGGGIYNDEGQLTIENTSRFIGNRAQVNGGALYTRFDVGVTISNSTFQGNIADEDDNDFGDGGAIFNRGSAVTISSSTFTGNQAWFGGGIFNRFGSLEDTASTFRGNIATQSGGALHNASRGFMQLEGTLLEGNTADVHGGGILNRASELVADNVTLSDNTAAVDGGGIYAIGSDGEGGIEGEVTVTNSRFLDNNASPDTGGAYYHNSGISSVTSSCIVGNSAVAVFNATDDLQTFTGNWWGAVDGPGGVGPGSGDTIGVNITFDPFESVDNLDCGPQQDDDDDDDDEDPTATPVVSTAAPAAPGSLPGLEGGTPTPALPAELPATGGRPVPPYALIMGVAGLLVAVSAGALILRRVRA